MKKTNVAERKVNKSYKGNNFDESTFVLLNTCTCT